MQVVTTKQKLRTLLNLPRKKGKIVLVPTMGALHAGHYSLMDRAREIAGGEGLVVVSLFVNPIQFNNAGDLQTYPRTFEDDRKGCEAHGADILFSPSNEEMYAPDRSTDVIESKLSSRLCGASRPGHFSGVCTVVAKLFNIVCPTDAVFGEKDYQQLAIIRRMVRDLDININIHGAKIVRQEDGLAFSSRNARLSTDQRKEAAILYRSMLAARKAYDSGERSGEKLLSMTGRMILDSPSEPVIDYIELFDGATLEPVQEVNEASVMALAVFFGDVRLIDNLAFSPDNR